MHASFSHLNIGEQSALLHTPCLSLSKIQGALLALRVSRNCAMFCVELIQPLQQESVTLRQAQQTATAAVH